MRHRPLRSAMSMVELVVVIGIIAVLIGLAIPAVMRVRESANAAACRNNMRQVGVALSSYMAGHGSLPLGSENRNDTWGAPGTTWAVQILPYIDHEDIYRKINFAAKDPSGSVFANTTNSTGSDAATSYVVQPFICPADRVGGQLAMLPGGTYSRSNYLGFFGTYPYGVERSDGAFGVNFGARPADFLDGMSNTVVVGEYLTGVPSSIAEDDPRGAFWLDRPGSSQIHSMASPNPVGKDVFAGETCVDRPDYNLPCSDVQNYLVTSAASRSRHRNGVNVVMGDGSVRFISNSISKLAWQALGTLAGDEIVEDDQLVSTGSSRLAAAVTAPAPGSLEHTPSNIRDHYLVVMRSGSAAQLKAVGATVKREYSEINAALIYVPKTSIDRVKRHPGIKSITYDHFVKTCAQTIPTGVSRIGATLSSAKAGDGKDSVDVDVAIIDTGIDLNHPDLNVVFDKGFGYSNGNDDSTEGHGTHVAGTVAALDNSFGVVGVAPGCRLYALKVLPGTGSGSLSDAIDAVIYCGNHADKIKVANMSLGSDVGKQIPAMDDAIKFCTDKGCMIVVAAGNEHKDTSGFTPANSPDAITVAALCDTDGKSGGKGPAGSFGDKDDTFAASFSNFGSKIDVVAPGEDILSTLPGGKYGTLTGTSMASPHVTGVVALILWNQQQNQTPSVTLPGIGLRNVEISPITPPQPPKLPGGGGKKMTVNQLRGILKGSATESIPGPPGINYPLVNASGF